MVEQLTHLDEDGRLKMVDVGDKERTERVARVRGEIRMDAATARLIADNKVAKGSVLEGARLAGIMAAKRTADLIPLCHPLPVSGVQVSLYPEGDESIAIEASVRTVGRTGVEMEALTAVSVAALTVYDMCKSVDRDMRIVDIHLVEKHGGSHGDAQTSRSEA